MPEFTLITPAQVREALLNRTEIALIDVRDEAPYATGHPLFAANIPLSHLELHIYDRVPRRNTLLVVYDNGEGLAQTAAARLQVLGYTAVHRLEGELAGWRDAGFQLFIDVNSPSKAFGELVEHERHTPSLPAPELARLQQENADLVVLDARRFDEYQTMSIPGGISVPGAELVLRATELVPSPATTIVVNCAGRTRSIIGSQSLINAGLPNPVYALRNGTIGWTLAGQALEKGQNRRYAESSASVRQQAAVRARQVADRAGAGRITLSALRQVQQHDAQTWYLFDVRDEAAWLAGHVSGSRHVPGGQLVQETDHYASVRGAKIALIDDDGVRANMSASWLAQMGWQVAVVDGLRPADFSESGPWQPQLPPLHDLPAVTAQQLAGWLEEGNTQVLDVTKSANYLAGHIPNAAWLQPSLLVTGGATALPDAERYVLTCGTSLLAQYSVTTLAQLTAKPVFVLTGGNQAWRAAGLPLETAVSQLLQPRDDRYQRPYEGTEHNPATMQAYLDWEYGLVEQLTRDGTHGFAVLPAETEKGLR